MSSSYDSKKPTTGWRKKIKRWSLVVIVVGVLGAIIHPFVFYGCSHLLIYSQSPTDADYAIVVGGSNCFEAALNAVKDGGVEKIILYKRHPTRLESIGLLPDSITMDQKELQQLGVDDSNIRVISITPGEGEIPLAIPCQFIHARPDTRAIVFADEFRSREVTVNVARLVPPDTRSRIRFVSVADKEIHAGNWWKTMAGRRAYFDRFFNLVTTLCYPNSPKSWKIRSFDEFRASAVAREG